MARDWAEDLPQQPENETPPRDNWGYNLDKFWDFDAQCPAVGFEFGPIDSPEDKIKELVAQGKSFDSAFRIISELNERRFTQEALLQVLSLIVNAQKPGLLADQVAWVARLHVISGRTMPQLAAKHGISKQAFQQGVKRLEIAIGHYISPSSRGQGARDTMKKRHYQKPKYE